MENLSEEIWSKIPGYSFCEASNKGRIRSVYMLKGGLRINILKQQISRKGYAQTRVFRNSINRRILCMVHRLIALAFLGKPQNQSMVVNHKDFNRSNNHIDNLEWVTQQQNIIHSFSKNGRLLFNRLKPSKTDLCYIESLIARGVPKKKIIQIFLLDL